MTQKQPDEPDVAHVFDQTNGVVDLGSNGPDADQHETGEPGTRTAGSIAMLSTQKP